MICTLNAVQYNGSNVGAQMVNHYSAMGQQQTDANLISLLAAKVRYVQVIDLTLNCRDMIVEELESLDEEELSYAYVLLAGNPSQAALSWFDQKLFAGIAHPILLSIHEIPGHQLSQDAQLIEMLLSGMEL